MSWSMILGAAAVLGLVAVAAHLLLTAFNRRGWIYYRNPDAPKGRSLGLIEEIYQPSTTHVIDHETLEDSLRHQIESSGPDGRDTDNLDPS